jgi:hypothetical protein
VLPGLHHEPRQLHRGFQSAAHPPTAAATTATPPTSAPAASVAATAAANTAGTTERERVHRVCRHFSSLAPPHFGGKGVLCHCLHRTRQRSACGSGRRFFFAIPTVATANIAAASASCNLSRSGSV